MSCIVIRKLRSAFCLGDREGLAFKLFSSFALSLFIILLLQHLAEAAMIRVLLHIPEKIKTEMVELSYQAEVNIQAGDMDELADWERGQRYYLFVLDHNQQVISGRDMHPHFEFKLQFARDIDTIFDNKVNQPIIALPLRTGHTLVIQFPYERHPARYFTYYFTIIQVVIAGLILGALSLLLARYLQTPLNKLKIASHRLAEGDFSVRVGREVGDTVTEFSALANSFDHMTTRINALSEKQKCLIRDVSHELKTPLARHDLAIHLLRRKLPQEYHGLLARLERESTEMNVLVSEILEYSRLENASYQLKLHPTDLSCLCVLQVEKMQDALMEHQTLCYTGASVEQLALVDHGLILRILNNLIGNAIKYAGEQAYIRVSVSATENNELELWVEDDGQGISPQCIDTIFDPFTRVQSSREKQSGGYGLGLAIVKEAVSIMNGRVGAENLTNGFRVRVKLPTTV
ncbi:histidine kinase sensor domain-containing protein (plasmid) [Photobacterium sp. DA100]|uniref:histidine kinase sensor domain-containing protein n=1 Tax=Photobacterium sp. DA100 TaxID=3027472 RepID=UPI00247A9E58|nr:histidine kinase sensor domain-containing protein [Photobacterium sp. DA100]WEM45689.1 histidine kinase sensor domain-containing protein [Photobacterium sp. DA100]